MLPDLDHTIWIPVPANVQLLQGWVVNGSQPRVPLGVSPVAITLIPGDAVVVYAECGIEFMNRAKPQYQFRKRTSIPLSSFNAFVNTFRSEFR